jgi:hypothetical protein
MYRPGLREVSAHKKRDAFHGVFMPSRIQSNAAGIYLRRKNSTTTPASEDSSWSRRQAAKSRKDDQLNKCMPIAGVKARVTANTCLLAMKERVFLFRNGSARRGKQTTQPAGWVVSLLDPHHGRQRNSRRQPRVLSWSATTQRDLMVGAFGWSPFLTQELQECLDLGHVNVLQYILDRSLKRA